MGFGDVLGHFRFHECFRGSQGVSGTLQEFSGVFRVSGDEMLSLVHAREVND